MNKELAANTTLSHYCIVSKIGAGGMGEVYLAQDTKLDRRVALKILPEEFAGDTERMRRFVQEARSASALNHPNIITIHEIGDCEGSNFIATEYVEGETLSARLRGESMSLGSTLEVAIQIASALQAAHNAGIVHRDIKPDNVMIRPDGFVKLLDFGIAKLTEKNREPIDEDAATAISAGTSPGMIVGTAGYMSPEQARGKQIDHRTDIFSFGVVFYEMLTKRHPFEGENAMDVIGSILHKDPTPIRQLLPDIPQDIERLINKTLRKDREERYQTAKDLLIDLKDARQELEVQSRSERTSPPNREEPNTRIMTATTADVSHTTSSAEYLVSEITKRKRGIAIGLIVLFLSLIGMGYWLFGNRATPAKQTESVAVMPFVNESGNADIEYLSDGMTETLISSLSQLPNLSVKARSTVFRYKGKTTDARTIGKELNVQAILNGRVVQRGDQLTLSLELVDAITENSLWSQQYNRKQTDLVTLQSEIARDVSNKLKTKLSGADVAKVEKTYTTDPEAYQLYLKGKFFWNKRTGESLKQAAELYRQAIDKDPNYALAYSGLAETFALFSSYDVAPANDSLPQAKAAALRALEIDDSLAEAHTALGFYLSTYEWDRVGSEKEYRRAIELKPNYPTAHHWLGELLSNLKRFDVSLVEMRRAEELDPLSAIIGTSLADTMVYARRYDEAIAQYKRTLIRNPNFGYAHQALGWVYGLNGMYPEAIAETRTAMALSNGSSAKGYLGLWLAKSGKRDEALKVLSELKQETTRGYVQSYTFALIYTGLGDKTEALNWLEKHMSGRSETANLYALAPELDDLRSEPRFKEMLKRMNLPD
jgi:eukaryotic-like serine/threonine-protein kinase